MTAKNHASNQLSSGKVIDVARVIDLLIEQYQHERRLTLGYDPNADTADLDTIIDLMAQLRSEYWEAMSQAHKNLFERWEASDNEDVAEVGRRMVRGEYQELAL